jgi:hypothetical protein
VKKVLVVLILSGIFLAIAVIFWYQEVQYLLPTPVPQGYQVVAPETLIRYDSVLTPMQHERPKLLHFFNPHCPCSRFNLKHFRTLNKTYGSQVDFYVVLTGEDKINRAKELIDSDITILIDRDGKLANACGVYSTPQAAIIQTSNRLYFRGNYNQSRYCTNKNSNFVQMALDSLMAQRSSPHFSELATQSYGCSIKPETEYIEVQ